MAGLSHSANTGKLEYRHSSSWALWERPVSTGESAAETGGDLTVRGGNEALHLGNVRVLKKKLSWKEKGSEIARALAQVSELKTKIRKTGEREGGAPA